MLQIEGKLETKFISNVTSLDQSKFEEKIMKRWINLRNNSKMIRKNNLKIPPRKAINSKNWARNTLWHKSSGQRRGRTEGERERRENER